MRLAGKSGLITAAASGIGRAAAVRFAREGAAVAVCDIDHAAAEAVVAAIRHDGGNEVALSGDLRDDAFARQIVRLASDHLGNIDFVLNHVGHPGPAAVEGLDMDDFALAMDLNCRSVVATTDAAIPVLRSRGGGSLLYTASILGLIGSYASPVYSMAKFGVIGFVRSLAKRLAPDNIRVNAICPGPTDTPMLRKFVLRADQQAPAGETAESLVQQRAEKVPFGRPARPEEIANAALFLISDEASYVSGIALPVDGAATA